MAYVLIRFLGVNLLNLLLEGFKLLTDAAGLLLLRLTLSNLSDGILYLLVALLQQFGCFLLRLLEDSLSASLDILDVALILGDGLFHILLALMDILALVLPVSLVADDVLQILVALDVFRTHDIEASLITSSGKPIFLAISMAKEEPGPPMASWKSAFIVAVVSIAPFTTPS